MVLFFVQAGAQITSPEADFHDTLDYPVFDGEDIFFVLHVKDLPEKQVLGELTANPPGGTPGWDFEWSVYDTATGDFVPFFSENDRPYSMVSDLEPGGYRVRIRSTDMDTVFRAWIFRDHPRISVEKNSEGKLKLYKYTCDYIVLNGTVRPDTITYYDPVSGQSVNLPVEMSFEWTSDNEELVIPNATSVLDPNTNYRPPTVDTWFFLTAEDHYGFTGRDSVFYETVQTKALFEVYIEDEDEPGTWSGTDQPEGEAPLEVKFLNRSENGEEFEWVFVDTLVPGGERTMITYDVEDTAEYTYYIPREYDPFLVSISEEGCVDTFRLETPVEVLSSKLDLPNFFSPNGDDVNDRFRVSSTSIKEFRIKIFNRYGRLVYEHEQTRDKFEWEGWDGTIRGKGRPAEPGVYFYIIEAIGWDAEKYRGGLYRGFVHLFRNKP